MKWFNRVRQTTSTTGTGDTITLGSVVGPNYFTLAEAGALVNDETVAVVEEGDDFAIYRVTVNAAAASVEIDSVIGSKISGVAGTSRLNLGGAAVIWFTTAAEDLDAILDAIEDAVNSLSDSLGDGAFLDVGTGAGTVAAGNDARFPAGGTNDRLLAWLAGAYAWTQLTLGLIPSGLITPSKLDDGVATSVLGRSAATDGARADISTSTNDRILARVSNALAWVQITIGMIPDSLITFAKLASGAIASQAQAEAGSATTVLMTPQRTAQAIAALTSIPTTYGAVGTYAFLATSNSASSVSAGDTIAGSSLLPAGVSGGIAGDPGLGLPTGGSAPSGTWRAMGFKPVRRVNDSNSREATLFLRIS